MKTGGKRGLTIILALATAFLAAVFAVILIRHGREADRAAGQKGETPLTWYVDYSWFNGNYPDSLVYREIREKTGTRISFQSPTESNDSTLGSMISSRDLPDIITMSPDSAEYKRLLAEKQVYPLNSLADLYDTSFYDVTDSEVRDYYTGSDSNIYAYPNAYYTPEDFQAENNIASNVVFLVRKDIYEAIGSPDMTTKEGFHQAVKKAAETFPETGGDVLIPIGGRPFTDISSQSFDEYLQDFLAVPYEKDGQYYDRNTDPEYLSWLRLFRQMNEEGLLAPDIFLDDQVQINENIEKGRYFCLFYQRTDLVDQELARYVSNPDSVYIAIDGPKNEAGDPYVLPTNGMRGWTVTMVSKSCENPKAAIRLIDFLLSEEGQKLCYLGKEGETYDVVDGKPVLKEEIRDMMRTDRMTYNSTICADYNLWMLMNLRIQNTMKQEAEPPLAQMEEWTYPYSAYTGDYDISLPESTSLGRKYLKLQELWCGALKQLLIAKDDADFDRILSDYRKERQEMGYEEVLSEKTRQLQANRQK